MASLPSRRTAWVLLVAALALPGQAVAHALIHRHLAQHHGEGAHQHGGASHLRAGAPAAIHPAEGFTSFIDERAHDHGHLDGVLLRASRSQVAPPPVALLAASPESVAGPMLTVRVAQGRAPARASPDAADPSRPRAPPHA